jgi:hypothetical protein
MPEQSATSQAEPDPVDAGEPKPQRPDEQPPAALACPRCRFAVGSADAPHCPECGVALRSGFVGCWVIDSGRWIRRMTLGLLVLSALYFSGALFLHLSELFYWYRISPDLQLIGLPVTILISFVPMDGWMPWWTWLSIGSCLTLLSAAAWVTKRNFSALPNDHPALPQEGDGAARRLFYLMLCVLLVSLVVIAAPFWYFMRH